MAFRSYLPQPFSTTHENVFYREFSRQLRAQYSNKDGFHILIGNVSCMGHQIDVLFIASGKVIVIDLKNYGGRLEFAENNPWRIWEGTDFVFVSGGGGIRNPYQQVNAYRHALRQYLHSRQEQILSPNHPDCNWGHIKGLVLFHQAIQFDRGTIPGRIQSYFSVADYSTVYNTIQDSFSSGLVLDDNEIQKLLVTLDVRDENVFDDLIESDPPQNNNVGAIASQRLDLIRRLSPSVLGSPDHLRALHYYHTVINLERYKEPKSLEPHLFPVNWGEVSGEIILNIESSPTFNTLYQRNLHEQFKKNIFVGINVLLNSVTVPLFQYIILINDVTDHRRITVNLSDLALNISSLEDRNLGEDEIEELTTLVNNGETLEEKIQAVRDYLSIIVELVPSLTLAFSEESLITSQLLSELKSLIRSNPTLEGTILKSYLLKQPTNASLENLPGPIAYITPLNWSQRRALELSFQQPLTVITGPPGTGKTQVVLNILANALLHKKKILFASKNNKAIDNVKEKLNSLVKEPNFFVRFGSKPEVREKVIPSLQQFSNRINHDLIEDNLDTFDNSLDKLKTADAKRSYHLKRLKSIPLLDKKIKSENTSLNLLISDFDSWKSSMASYLEIDRNVLSNLAKEPTNQLKQLSAYQNALMKLLFSLFQEKKFANQLANTKAITPKSLFTINPKLNTVSTNYDSLVAWYKELRNSIVKVIDIHKEHDAKQQSVISKEESIKQLKQQYEGFLATHQDDLASLHAIEKELPTLGLDVLNQTIQKRLFLGEEDSLQKFIEYIPDNIPWRDQDIPKFEEVAKDFLQTFSAISVTSLSIKNGFPLSPWLFDLVVVDEASQCDIASAIPLIYRAKQLVVIGDPLQLKHISKVESYEERYLQDKLNLSTYQFNYVNNSLYDHCDSLAKISKMSSVLLTEHFRCHPEIINYSNEIFYRIKFGQDLTVKTKAEDFIIEPKGIYWVDVVGTQHNERNSNIAEVDKAIALATSLAAKHPNASIGITTPFRHQANELKERIPEHIRNRVTADTVHRYQGDEKDIMILSLVVTGNSSPGKVNWINNKVPYLINVAVTRARNTLYIVGNAGYCMDLPGDSPLGYLVRYVDNLGHIKR